MTDPFFPTWQAYYRDEHQNRATLSIRTRPNLVILTTATHESLYFTPLEAGLFLDAFAAAIRNTGSVP